MEVVGDGDARISYRGNWSVQNATGADQGSVHTTDPAAVISLMFVGSSIEIDAVKSPKGANFTVVLDTSTYGPYSLYSPTTAVGNVWSQSQLNPTDTHTIALQKAQASAGPDSTLALNVDAFRIPAALSSASPSSSTSVSSTSSSSTSQSTTVSRNSASSSSIRSATIIVAFSMPHSPSASATAAAVDAAANSSGPGNRISVILGTIAGVVIFLCLVTIPIVYIKRKREENLAQELKASTTPAYQTRTAKGLLMPLGIYRLPTSTTSPTSPTSIDRRWGFGSQIYYNNQSVSPSATSLSPRGAAGGGRTSFEDTERSIISSTLMRHQVQNP